MIELRNYQAPMLDEARVHMREGRRRVLLVAPTGSGKRIMACHTMATAAARGKRCILAVHRQELLDQASATLTEAGVPHGIIAPGWASSRQPVQVASIPTLGRRLDSIEAPDFIFTDEAHHSASKTWARILERWSKAFSLGFTATPLRLDGKGLGPFFDAMVVGPSTRELIDGGYLSKYRLYAPPAPTLDDIPTVAGDYDRAGLRAAIDRPQIVGDIVGHYQRLCHPKQAIVFAVGIQHSQHLAEAFCTAGIAAVHVDGETPSHERRQILADFAAWRFRVLCSVDILGEGLDVPGIEAVICARPTQSLTLCLQQWGRGLRPKPEPLVILDHAGNCRRHGLPDDERTWELADAKAKPEAPRIRVCKACFATFRVGPRACPECGAALATEKPRKARQVDGELAEVTAVDRDRLRREQALARDYDSLVALGRARGYRYPTRWAQHVMRARG